MQLVPLLGLLALALVGGLELELERMMRMAMKVPEPCLALPCVCFLVLSHACCVVVHSTPTELRESEEDVKALSVLEAVLKFGKHSHSLTATALFTHLSLSLLTLPSSILLLHPGVVWHRSASSHITALTEACRCA